MFCRPPPFPMAPLLIIFNLPSTLAQETMAVSGNTVAVAIFLSPSHRGRGGERGGRKMGIVAELVREVRLYTIHPHKHKHTTPCSAYEVLYPHWIKTPPPMGDKRQISVPQVFFFFFFGKVNTIHEKEQI